MQCAENKSGQNFTYTMCVWGGGGGCRAGIAEGLSLWEMYYNRKLWESMWRKDTVTLVGGCFWGQLRPAGKDSVSSFLISL